MIIFICVCIGAIAILLSDSINTHFKITTFQAMTVGAILLAMALIIYNVVR